METERPAAIACFWEWVPEGRHHWKLVESIGLDDDGYAITPSVHAAEGRHPTNGWMLKYPEDEDSDADPEQVMGRAVTCWDMESGVSLVRIHPPEWIPFLSPMFYEKITKKKAWLELIEGGYDLFLGTARAAEDFMFKEE